MDGKRKFLTEVIAAGLEHGTMTPDALLERLTAEVLANHLPKDQHAKLLQASLTAKVMSPALIVDTIGVEVLCQHLPVPALWSCVADAAEQALSGEPAPRASEKKTATKSSPKSKSKSDNGKAAAPTPAPKPNVAKAAPAPVRGSAFSRPTTAPPVRARGSRGSEFDVDTDVGEEWPPNDPLSEAEALGATPEIIEEHDLTDWPQEETRNVDISTGPKR